MLLINTSEQNQATPIELAYRAITFAANEVIRIGASAADRREYKAALERFSTHFERMAPDAKADCLHNVIHDVAALREAVQLAQSVAYYQPISLTSRDPAFERLQFNARAFIKKTLEGTTPEDKENLLRFAKLLVRDHPELFLAAVVCTAPICIVAKIPVSLELDLNTSFGLSSPPEPPVSVLFGK